MLRLLGAAAIAAALMTAARADDLPCAPTQAALAGLSKMMREVHGQPFLVQDAAKVTAFMAVVNAAPPPSDYTADAVVGFAVDQGIAFALHHKDTNTLCGPIKLGGDTADAALKAGGIARGEDT